MNTKTNIESSTGVVHAINRDEDGNVEKYTGPDGSVAMCCHRNYYESLPWGLYHKWPRTDKPVTCKRCLKALGLIGKYILQINGKQIELTRLEVLKLATNTSLEKSRKIYELMGKNNAHQI